MEPEQLLENLKKALARRVNQLALSVTSGGVDNMEKYNYILGKIHVTDQIKQEISNLLNPKEPDNDDDKVTRIRR